MKNAKASRVIQIIITVGLAVGFFFLSGFAAIMIPANSRNFYKSQFRKYDSVRNVREQSVYLDDADARAYLENITEDQLLDLMDHTMLYCMGGTDELNITVDGKVLKVYREDEYSHMRDCRALFIGGEVIGGIAFLLLLIGLTYVLFFGNNYFRRARKVPFITIGVCFGLLAVVGLAALINFDAAFETFHRIFFSGNWTFSNGLMINMIGPIFPDLVANIAAGWLISLTVFTLLFAGYNIYLSRHGAFGFAADSRTRREAREAENDDEEGKAEREEKPDETDRTDQSDGI